jgi:hypothetical protein
MEKDIAIPILLDVWQCTSEYAIMEQYDDSIRIRFKFWDSNQNEIANQTALLIFKNVWECKYSRFNKTRYYPKEIEHTYKSYYLKISNSSWLEEEKNKRTNYDANWKKYDKLLYNHYVFQNNSYYIEIIATDVEFKIEGRLMHNENIWNAPFPDVADL